MENCIFCKIINKEIPANIVYEDNYLIAFLDINPISDGHTLIVPKKHFKDLNEINEETGGKVLVLAAKIGKAIVENFNFEGYSIWENNGHFQDVPHFHLHVIGRHKNNDLKIKGPEAPYKSEKEHLQKIKTILNKGLN